MSYRQRQGPLAGLRLGLSGAVPDRADWSGRALDWEILRLVSALSEGLFRYGGRLVHGTHPSFTPRILRQAEAYATKRHDPLVTLVRSRLFKDDGLVKEIEQERRRGAVELIETDAVVPANAMAATPADTLTRNASLQAMRERLIDELDALVLVGGKRWTGSGIEPGTLKELNLALERGLPCFLLGGFGGMTEDLVGRPEYRDRLDNGLSSSENDYLMTTRNHGRAVAMIIDGLVNLTAITGKF